MNPIVEKVYQIGIIPVIAFNSVDEALPLCKALENILCSPQFFFCIPVRKSGVQVFCSKRFPIYSNDAVR